MNWYKIAQQNQIPFLNDTESEKPNDPFYAKTPKTTEFLEPILEELHGLPAIENALNKYGFNWDKIQFPEEIIIKVEVDDKPYIIINLDNPELTDPKQWLYTLSDFELYSLIPPIDYEELFWKTLNNYNSVLYHATSPENLESIKKDGLQPKDITRGINNRSTGAGIFTSDDPDSISSYGELIITINLGQMKKNGYMPRVSKETPLEEADTMDQLAHKLGLENMDFDSEYASEGLYHSTVIFYDEIPPIYLGVYE